MFKLAGSDQKSAAAAAQTVMTMETKLAEASLDNVTLRDPAAAAITTPRSRNCRRWLLMSTGWPISNTKVLRPMLT